MYVLLGKLSRPHSDRALEIISFNGLVAGSWTSSTVLSGNDERCVRTGQHITTFTGKTHFGWAMFIFNSYVEIPEGTRIIGRQWKTCGIEIELSSSKENNFGSLSCVH